MILSILFGLSAQQQDPLKAFCRRFGHQTALIDRRYDTGFVAKDNDVLTKFRLFIDGGLLNYNPLNQNPLNYTSTEDSER